VDVKYLLKIRGCKMIAQFHQAIIEFCL